jgi:hypothetical protein
MGLPQGLGGGLFLMSEVPLYHSDVISLKPDIDQTHLDISQTRSLKSLTSLRRG